MHRKRIVIADDDPSLVRALTLRCERLGLEVTQAFDGESALDAIRNWRPDVACLDVGMPNGDGMNLCEILSQPGVGPPMPLIILTGQTDADTIMKCHELCVYYVLKCEDVWPRVEPLLCEILGINTSSAAEAIGDRGVASSTGTSMSTEQRDPVGTVLIIDDDLDMVRTIKSFLARTNLTLIHCASIEEVEQYCHQGQALICDIHLPESRGTFLVHDLRNSGCQIPVIMMSGDNRKATVLEVANTGVQAFLTKPFGKRQLLDALRQHTGLEIEERPLKTAAGCRG